MTLFFIARGFRKSLYKEPIKIIEKKFDPNELLWNPIAFTPAQAKYKFNMFSIRLGSISRYFIGEESPSPYGWNQLGNPPNGSSFEEAKDKEFMYVRMLKNGVPEKGAMVQRRLIKEKEPKEDKEIKSVK